MYVCLYIIYNNKCIGKVWREILCAYMANYTSEVDSEMG